MWWIETKFRGMRRNFVGNFLPVGRNCISLERNFPKRNEISFWWGEISSAGAKFRLSRIGSWLQNAAVIITSCKRTCTCKRRDHYLKKKHCNDCYNCGENLRHDGAFWLVPSLLLSQHNFVVNVSLPNRCISTISLRLSIALWFTL